MNDDVLVSIGRAFIEWALQREQLIRSNQQLQQQVIQLEEAAKPKTPEG